MCTQVMKLKIDHEKGEPIREAVGYTWHETYVSDS